MTIRDFWKRLFASPEETTPASLNRDDAAGMIRRLTDRFSIGRGGTDGSCPSIEARPLQAVLMRADDSRRTFRVFLACSLELRAERAGFDAAVMGLADDPGFHRICVPEPVRWETSASGAHVTSAQHGIQLSVDFPKLDVVVVAIGDRVGQWTRNEYEVALELFRSHKRPRLLLYVRTDHLRSQDTVDFREAAFVRGVVAVPYSTPDEWVTRLPVDILREFEPLNREVDVSRLRRQFIGWASASLGLGALTVLVSRVMSLPTDGVTYARVLGLLLAPVVLMLTTLGLVVSYRRLLSGFRAVWRSAAYTDDAVWAGFAGLIPAWVTPRRTLAAQERRSLTAHVRLVLTLLLVFAAAPIGAANAVFNEILVWEYVVGWHTQPSAGDTPSSSLVNSIYVDHQRNAWPFTLQEPAVREFSQAHPAELIYVHAHGQFCDQAAVQPMPMDRRFRCNLGPEVKLPLYPWIFVTAFALSSVMAVLPIVWLAGFRRSLALLPWEE